MGTIIRPPFLQTAVPLSQSNLQRVSELGELSDLEVKLVDLLVRKLRDLPAGRTACVFIRQDFYEFL